ncbi:uncharacterized protein LOC134233176 [Saccostrea cucullata]|uniref:uncharacterized protein LOC134233176 n=1 Tax=Saccostrea cuccullata TaxID=36930 RepID=UPI002ED4C4CD
MKGFTSIVFFSVNFECVVKYILSDNQTGVCTTNQLGELLGCCANYRKVGTKCEECWPGTYGINCKYNCPFGYYGRFCRQKCQCSTCNHVSGCAILHSAVTESDIEEDVIFDWRTVVISVSGCCGVSIIVALVFYCKLRKGPSNLLIPVHSVHTEAIIRPQLNHCKPNKENKCFTENDYKCEMEFEPYDILNLKVQRDTCIDEELCPSYDSSVFNQCEKIEYETKPMGRHEKPTKEHTNKQTNKTQKRKI